MTAAPGNPLDRKNIISVMVPDMIKPNTEYLTSWAAPAFVLQLSNHQPIANSIRGWERISGYFYLCIPAPNLFPRLAIASMASLADLKRMKATFITAGRNMLHRTCSSAHPSQRCDSTGNQPEYSTSSSRTNAASPKSLSMARRNRRLLPQECSIDRELRFGEIDKGSVQWNSFLPWTPLYLVDHEHHVVSWTVQTETTLFLR